jgi:hypothetical protein
VLGHSQAPPELGPPSPLSFASILAQALLLSIVPTSQYLDASNQSCQSHFAELTHILTDLTLDLLLRTL